MDMQAMIGHYRDIFTNDQDVYDFILHDLRHMGLTGEEIDGYIRNLREHLNLEQS